MRRQVLYISYDGLTDPLGQSQIIPYLRLLAKRGFSIVILSFEKRQNWELSHSQIEQQLKLVDILWRPLVYTKYPPVLSTTFDIIRMIIVAKQIVARYNISIVHCRSYIAAFAGLMLKRSRNTSFIFDMRGFWADERVEGNIWSKTNLIYKIVYTYFKRKEIEFLQQADHVITLTQRSVSIIEALAEKPNLSVSVIPTCVDEEFFINSKVDLIKLRQELNIAASDFVLLYVGSLGTWYMLDEMMKLYSLLRKRITNSRFLILTQDSPELLNAICSKYEIPWHDIIFRRAAREAVPAYISLCNWSIFFIKPVFSKIASSPTKLAEILALKKPVLCNGNVGDIDYLFQNYSLGYCLTDFDEISLNRAVDFILAYQSKRVENRIIEDWFSLESGVDKLEIIYKSLLK